MKTGGKEQKMEEIIMCPICYGKETIDAAIPAANLIKVLNAKEIEHNGDETALLRDALQYPIASQHLHKMVRPGMKVSIITDDITRPTPTHIMLPLVLEELYAGGVHDGDITVIFATGSHRRHTEEEKERLIGNCSLFKRIRVVDHDAFVESQLVDMGVTKRGTPVYINKWVAESELKIMLGLIKPHCVAGYTGGGKSILPGVSSIKTIIADHNYTATAHPLAILGVIDGNPIRSDIEDAASLLSPNFILNAILDRKKQVVGAVAGDMIEAHRKGASMVDEMICVDVDEVAEIAVCGCSYPSSINLYQAATAPQACTRIKDPIIKKGGICIVAAPCEEGIGGGPLQELMRNARTLEDVIKTISAPGFFMHDQWAAQLWTAVLMHCDVYLVARGITAADAADMKCSLFPSVDSALESAFAKMGKDARVSVLTDGPYIIPKLTRKE